MESSNTNSILLNSGHRIPICGLGTAGFSDFTDVVYEALKRGVRLIDTAYKYGNEHQIGAGINKAIKEGICK